MVSQRNRSLMWIMPRGSSSVSLNRGMRDTPASLNMRNSSDNGSLSASAMMSARGTMMSLTRKPPKRNRRRSISRSSVENAASASGSSLRPASTNSRKLGERIPMRLSKVEIRLCVLVLVPAAAASPATARGSLFSSV